MEQVVSTIEPRLLGSCPEVNALWHRLLTAAGTARRGGECMPRVAVFASAQLMTIVERVLAAT